MCSVLWLTNTWLLIGLLHHFCTYSHSQPTFPHSNSSAILFSIYFLVLMAGIQLPTHQFAKRQMANVKGVKSSGWKRSVKILHIKKQLRRYEDLSSALWDGKCDRLVTWTEFGTGAWSQNGRPWQPLCQTVPLNRTAFGRPLSLKS